jgi:uncharacterized phage protein gp47/JayE
MAYQPPSISSAGLSINVYEDILNDLIAQFQAIYGQQVYLGTDSADYQNIAINALKHFDVEQALQQVYLSFNPLTAVGAALDSLGKLIGPRRKQATYSTVSLQLTGTPNAVINNGVAQDVNGNYWLLPPNVVIPASGQITVTATAQQIGNINALAGQINKIATPTAGWISVTNPSAAISGSSVESDSSYRARLLISQAGPGMSMLASIAAAVAAVPGVTRSVVYENYFGYTASWGTVNTNGTTVTLVTGYGFDATDVNQSIWINGSQYTISAVNSSTSLVLTASAGTQNNVSFYIGDGLAIGPGHSISAVVEGGSSTAIAQAIYSKRSVGVLTNGTTSVVVTDPKNGNTQMTVSYYVLGYVYIYVAISVHGLAGFTTATLSSIQSDIVNYLNSLGIGQAVVYSELYGAALNARPNPDAPIFSIRSLVSGYQTASTTGNTTSGSTSVTVASSSGISVGQTIVGSGIPNSTTVTAISGTTLTISQAATATASNVTLSFFITGTTDIVVGFNQAAYGLASNVVVISV